MQVQSQVSTKHNPNPGIRLITTVEEMNEIIINCKISGMLYLKMININNHQIKVKTSAEKSSDSCTFRRKLRGKYPYVTRSACAGLEVRDYSSPRYDVPLKFAGDDIIFTLPEGMRPRTKSEEEEETYETTITQEEGMIILETIDEVNELVRSHPNMKIMWDEKKRKFYIELPTILTNREEDEDDDA